MEEEEEEEQKEEATTVQRLLCFFCLRRRKMFIQYQYLYNVREKGSEFKTKILSWKKVYRQMD